MSITPEKLEERMQKRRKAVAGTGTFLESHGCLKTGAGVVVMQRPWGEKQILAYFFKPRAFNGYWKSEELVSNHQRLNVLTRLQSLLENEKAAAKAPHDLKVGDIVADIWGVTMRDVTFYKVTDIPHPRKVTLTKLRSKITSGDWMSGLKVPDTDAPATDETATMGVSMKHGTAEILGSSISHFAKWDGNPVSIYSD